MVRAGRMGPTWILVGAWLAPPGAVAQASPEQGARGNLHVDLGRYFFVDDTALSAATRHLNDQLAAVDAMRTSPPGSGRDLLRALELRDSVQFESDRLWAYYNLRSALDTRDLASARAKDDLDTRTSGRTEWVTARLASIDGNAFNGMMRAESGLTRYASEAAAARRAPAEARSATADRLVSEVGALATDWQFPLWQRLPPDARDARAFVLLETLRSHDRVATLHGYPSFLTQSYGDRGLAVDEIASLTLEVRANAALFRRFLSARAAREAGPPAASPPPVPVDSARAWMKAGLAPLGEEYDAEVDALLDPANGRLEMAGGEYRRAGGFSFVSPGRTTGVYMALFSGSLRDASRLVHEPGHAIHRRLMDVHGVPYPYRGGPLLMEPGGIDLHDPQLLPSALALLERELAACEAMP